MNQQILPAVAAAIFNPRGEVLLQRRGDVDQWCVISGHVEFGETLEAAILREIEEETTLRGRVVRLIGVYSSPESQTYSYADKTVQYITTYFEVELEGDIADQFSNSETKALQFFDPEHLPADMAQINPFWLHDAVNRSGGVYVR